MCQSISTNSVPVFRALNVMSFQQLRRKAMAYAQISFRTFQEVAEKLMGFTVVEAS